MNNSRIAFVAILMIATVVLGACAPAPTPTVPPPTAAPVVPPTATTAPTAAPAAPTAASAAPTTAAAPSAQSVVLVAALAASNENPPIANDEKNVTGNATVTVSLTKDAAGKTTAAKVKFDFTVKGLLPTSVVNIAHIHKGAATENGGVVVDTGLKPGEAKLTGDTLTLTKADVDAKPEVADDIVANPGNYYFNVHTALNAGGVVRGQLKKQ